jgi:aspartyl-tRNA(Asn)/glutamyl-tRNA(Gln) amidotransferase subunit A
VSTLRLTTLVVVAGVGFGLTAPFTALLVTELGAGPAVAGLAVSSIAVSLLAIDLFGTRWVPRLDARSALSWAALIFGIGSLIQAAAPTVAVVIAGRVLQGAGGALFMGGGVQLIVRLAPEGAEGRAIGAFNASWFSGIAMGPPLGGWLAHLGSPLFGLRLVFGVAGAVNIVASVLNRRSLPSLPSDRPRELGWPQLGGLGTWPIRGTLVLTGVGQAVRGGLAMTVVPLLGYDALGVDTTVVSVALFGLSVVEVSTMRAAGRASDRLGRRSLLTAALLAGVVSCLLIAAAGSQLMFVLAVASLGLAVGGTWVVPVAMVVDLAPDQEAGLAAYRIAADLGMLIGSSLAGGAVALSGERGAMTWGAGVLVLSIVVTHSIGETRRTFDSEETTRDHTLTVVRPVPRPAGGDGAGAQPGAVRRGDGAPRVHATAARSASGDPALLPGPGHRARHRLAVDRGRRGLGMSDDTTLADLTATELLGLYASGRAGPVEATEACLARIDQVDPAVNAVVLNLGDLALDAARRSAERWAAGEPLALDGVPYGLKDIIATAGIASTGGSKLYLDRVPTESAALAERLEAAGGVMVAKLHTFEFACGGPHNQAHGPCRNPWDLQRVTGGSSSGSGAAVAAREMPLAIGTDTGGSIRNPSAFCGLTGLKPTFGRVPRHGVMGLSWTLDHAGPMTRSAEDCARVLSVVAGRDGRDPTSSSRSVPDYIAACEQPVAGVKVARPGGWLEDLMHPQVRAIYEASIAALVDLGVEIVDVDLPTIDLVTAAGWTVMFAEMLSLHEPHWDSLEQRDTMGRGLLAATPFVTSSDYLRALRYRSLFQREVEAAMDGCVALVCPGSQSVAPRLDDLLADIGDDEVDWLTVAVRTHLPFNLTGSPGLCLPCGFVDGLPTSVQLVGHPHGEEALFALGAAYQRATDHHQQRPSLLAGSAPLGASA